MKAKLFFLVMLSLFAVQLCAQTRGQRLSKEEVINRKWSFILEKAQLSPADAAKVEPIFRETELELWDLLAKNREIFRLNRRRNQEGAPNYEAINDAIVNFEVENASIQRKFYLKLKRVVAAETINRILNAERDYKRELTQRMQGQQRQRNPQE